MSYKKEQQKLAEAMREKLIADYQKATSHRRPVTRREFLGSGVLGFSGTLFLPSVLNLIMNTRVAQAAANCEVSQTSRVAFININLAGGWSPAANWLPRDAGGQLLPSYSQLGMGTAPATTTAFANNALFTQNSANSGFLAGVRATASAAVMGRTSFVGMPVRSGDDTADNRFDIGGLLAKAGLAGSKLPNLGRRNNATGVGQQPAFNVYPATPLPVTRVTDAVNAIGFAGSLNTLNANQQLAMVKMVKSLSETQARSLASLSGGENLSGLVECATDQNLANLAAGSADVDPRNVNGMAAIWNLNDQNQLAMATVAMNSISGAAGAGGLELGGYDYHGNARNVTDARDREVGELLGRVLSTAQALAKPVFISITSDGSVRSQDSTTISDFVSDSGDKGAVLMLAFNPSGAPATSGNQIGGFTVGQSVDTFLPTGGSPETAGAAVFANWCALNKDLATFERTLRNPFTRQQMDAILKFS